METGVVLTELKIKSELDLNAYSIGQIISDEQFADIKLIKHDFHGD